MIWCILVCTTIGICAIIVNYSRIEQEISMEQIGFNDWNANVSDIVRFEMKCELDELGTYDESEARMYWQEGYTVKRFFKEVLDQTDVEREDFDVRFDL